MSVSDASGDHMVETYSSMGLVMALYVVYMPKSVGDSTPRCGTPFLNWRCVDVLFLNVVYALRSPM